MLPFRYTLVAGGWEKQQSTTRLNVLFLSFFYANMVQRVTTDGDKLIISDTRKLSD